MGFNRKIKRRNADEVEGAFKGSEIQQREVIESVLLVRMP